MAMRVKNVQEGFIDGQGAFHPIRASSDYSAKRAGESHKKKATKRRTKTTTKRKKPVTKRRATKRIVKKATGARKRNPIPANWVPARVRKIGQDIQVMFTGRPKKKTTARKKTRRR